jgi:hypothetical protein
MRTLVAFLFLNLVGLSAVNAAQLTVENRSNRSVSLGQFRGIQMPSLCERGSGYEPCMEEAFVKFRPLSRETENIQGTVTVNVKEATRERSLYLLIDGRRQIDILDSCEGVTRDDLYYTQILEDELRLTEIRKEAVCLKKSKGRILVD